MAFSRPHSEEALRTASDTRNRITGTFLETHNFDLLSFEEALEVNEYFFETAFKPCKWTLLHRFILNYLEAEWNYSRRKSDDEFISSAYRILKHYNVHFKMKQEITSDYKWYMFERLRDPLRRIAHEAFCILLSDKELMRRFGERIADAIADISPAEHPNYLQENGRLKRSTSWPRWLQDALFYRENGRCALCSTDLTRVFLPNAKIQIDHIIPISRGGTTDPTNLQMLCARCNQDKGNRSNQVGEFIYVPWEFG